MANRTEGITKKNTEKALAKRDKALGTFTAAIKELEKANGLLAEAVIEGDKERQNNRERIEHLRNVNVGIGERRDELHSQMQDNGELIRRLSEFTV